jgi:nucleoid DNA-binding protein
MTPKWSLSDDDILAQIPAAKKRALKADETEPRAKSARYNAETGEVVVELRNGGSFSFPTEMAQGLKGKSPRFLARVEVSGSGAGLHWEDLNAHFSVKGLASSVFGSKSWMKELAAKGGQAKTLVKQRAARLNGRLGGRPPTGMTKEELVVAVSARTGLAKKDTEAAIRATIDTIQHALEVGQKVTLVGFGTFQVRERAAREGRNPRTGEVLKIPSRRAPSFTAGKAFKELVEDGSRTH